MDRLLAALSLVCLMAAGAFATVDGVVSGNIGSTVPDNITYLYLSDADVTDATDSLGADSSNVYGPYKLTNSGGQPMFAGFQFHYPAGLLPSGDSIEISYAFTSGPYMADTLTWVVLDTVTTAAKAGTYTALASFAAYGIVFRIYNVDSTQTIISKRIAAFFKNAFTYTRNK